MPYKRSDIDHTYFRHIGLYAYRKETLISIAKLAPTQNELIESLEQLRWLDNGYAIHTAITEIETPNVDTPQDLENILKKAQ